MIRQNNIAKYKFKTLQVGGEFEVDKKDLISMKNSLRIYNKNHELNIVVDYTEIDDKIIVTRTS